MNREAAVAALLRFEVPLEVSLAHLSAFAWDSEAELAVLHEANLARVLSRYVAGELSGSQVEAWANAVEGREDVGFSSESTREVLHELANPGLTNLLTAARAGVLLTRLS